MVTVTLACMMSGPEDAAWSILKYNPLVGYIADEAAKLAESGNKRRLIDYLREAYLEPEEMQYVVNSNEAVRNIWNEHRGEKAEEIQEEMIEEGAIEPETVKVDSFDSDDMPSAEEIEAALAATPERRMARGEGSHGVKVTTRINPETGESERFEEPLKPRSAQGSKIFGGSTAVGVRPKGPSQADTEHTISMRHHTAYHDAPGRLNQIDALMSEGSFAADAIDSMPPEGQVKVVMPSAQMPMGETPAKYIPVETYDRPGVGIDGEGDLAQQSRVAVHGGRPHVHTGKKECLECKNGSQAGLQRLPDKAPHREHMSGHDKFAWHIRRLPNGRMTTDDRYGTELPEHNHEFFDIHERGSWKSTGGKMANLVTPMSVDEAEEMLHYLGQHPGDPDELQERFGSSAEEEGVWYNTDLNERLGIPPSAELSWFFPSPGSLENAIERGLSVSNKWGRKTTKKGKRTGGLGTDSEPDIGHHLRFIRDILQHKEDAKKRKEMWRKNEPELAQQLEGLDENGQPLLDEKTGQPLGPHREGKTPCALCNGHGTTDGHRILAYLAGHKDSPTYSSMEPFHVTRTNTAGEEEIDRTSGRVDDSHPEHADERESINEKLRQLTYPFNWGAWPPEESGEDPLARLENQPNDEYLCPRCSGYGDCSTCAGAGDIQVAPPQMNAEERADFYRHWANYAHAHSLASNERPDPRFLQETDHPDIDTALLAQSVKREAERVAGWPGSQYVGSGETLVVPNIPPKTRMMPSFFQTEPGEGQWKPRSVYVKPPQPQQGQVGVYHGHPKRPWEFPYRSGTGMAPAGHIGTMSASRELPPAALTAYGKPTQRSFRELIESGLYPEGEVPTTGEIGSPVPEDYVGGPARHGGKFEGFGDLFDENQEEQLPVIPQMGEDGPPTTGEQAALPVIPSMEESLEQQTDLSDPQVLGFNDEGGFSLTPHHEHDWVTSTPWEKSESYANYHGGHLVSRFERRPSAGKLIGGAKDIKQTREVPKRDPVSNEIILDDEGNPVTETKTNDIPNPDYLGGIKEAEGAIMEGYGHGVGYHDPLNVNDHLSKLIGELHAEAKQKMPIGGTNEEGELYSDSDREKWVRERMELYHEREKEINNRWNDRDLRRDAFKYPNIVWNNREDKHVMAALRQFPELHEGWKEGLKIGDDDDAYLYPGWSEHGEKALYNAIRAIHPGWTPQAGSHQHISPEDLVVKSDFFSPIDSAWLLVKAYSYSATRV